MAAPAPGTTSAIKPRWKSKHHSSSFCNLSPGAQKRAFSCSSPPSRAVKALSLSLMRVSNWPRLTNCYCQGWTSCGQYMNKIWVPLARKKWTGNEWASWQSLAQFTQHTEHHFRCTRARMGIYQGLRHKCRKSLETSHLTPPISQTSAAQLANSAEAWET